MSTPTDLALDAPQAPSNGAQGAPTGSILDDLRAIRQEKAEAAPPTLVLDVAGYGEPSRLAVVYRYPAAGYDSALKAAQHERMRAEKDATLNGNADLLIVCCASLVGKRPDGKIVNLLTDEVLEPAEVVDPAYPASRFNATLAEKLGIEIGEDVERKARFVCRHVFSPGAQRNGRYEGDLGLIAHGNLVFAWLQGVNRERDEEQAGE